MISLPAIVALSIGAAGWYYLFYSPAAHKLQGIETRPLNQRRIRLRRVGGSLMLLLAVAFFAGFEAVDPVGHPDGFILVWTAVMILLALIVVLALIDLRLTWHLRNKDRHGH